MACFLFAIITLVVIGSAVPSACCDHRVRTHAMAGAIQGVVQEAQLASRIAQRAGVGISRGGISGVVDAVISLEVARFTLTAVLADLDPVARQGLNHGAIHAEVLVQEPIAVVGKSQYFGEEFDGCASCNQSLTVLGEVSRRPDGVVPKRHMRQGKDTSARSFNVNSPSKKSNLTMCNDYVIGYVV